MKDVQNIDSLKKATDILRKTECIEGACEGCGLYIAKSNRCLSSILSEHYLELYHSEG